MVFSVLNFLTFYRFVLCSNLVLVFRKILIPYYIVCPLELCSYITFFFFWIFNSRFIECRPFMGEGRGLVRLRNTKPDSLEDCDCMDGEYFSAV